MQKGGLKALQGGEPLRGWIQAGIKPEVVRRALKCALVVGVVLIAINHGDVILKGQIDGTRLLKICFTLVVPYLVSTISSVAAILQFRDRQLGRQP